MGPPTKKQKAARSRERSQTTGSFINAHTYVKKHKAKIYILPQSLQRNLKLQSEKEENFCKYLHVLNEQKAKFVPFSIMQTNPSNEFSINSILKSYYERINRNKLITAYGGIDTKPPAQASPWTELEEVLIINPIIEYMNYNIPDAHKLVAFSLQKIYYNGTQQQKTSVTDHKDPIAYKAIAGFTIDASPKGRCYLTLTSSGKIINKKTLKKGSCYILHGDSVNLFKHRIDVEGSRIAAVVRFVEMSELQKIK